LQRGIGFDVASNDVQKVDSPRGDQATRDLDTFVAALPAKK